MEEVEARAALVGLQTMSRYFNGEVVLEMDNQNIIAELTPQKPSRTACYGLIMDMKDAMKGFAACNVQYGIRKINKLAHGLATLNRSMGDKLMIADVPQGLRSLMLSEFNAPSE